MDANRRTFSKEIRTAKKLKKLAENEFFEEEDLLYGPGMQNNRKCFETIVKYE